MLIKSLHQELENYQSHVPIIAMPIKSWEKQLNRFANDYFSGIVAKNIPTPIAGIFCDYETSNAGRIKINVTKITIENFEISFYLKSEGPIQGYMSKHTVIIEWIVFDIITNSGSLYLIRKDQKYKVKPSSFDPANPNARQDHIDYLMGQGLTQEELDYFEEFQEPSAAMLLANSWLTNLDTPFLLFNFSKIFPSFKFKGDFEIKKIIIDQGTPDEEILISIVPSKLTKTGYTECQFNELQQRTFGRSTYQNDNITLQGGTHRNTINGEYPIITHAPAEMFLFIPEIANKSLFGPVSKDPDDPKVVLQGPDNGSIGFPPFNLKYGSEVYVRGDLSFEWNNANPIINVKADLTMDLNLGIYLKLLKWERKLAEIDNTFDYTINYKGTLVELYNGDINFVAEMYDPTNFTIQNTNFESVLPDCIDNLFEKVIKHILQPIMQISITAIVIYVTWPFMSNYVSAALENWTIGQGVNTLHKVKISDYYSNQKSSIIGIKTIIQENG